MRPPRCSAYVLGVSFAALLLTAAGADPDSTTPRVGTWRAGADGARVPTDLTPAPDIANPLFSLLASLIDDDLYGRVSKSRVAAGVEAEGGSDLPWQEMLWLTREPVPGWARSEITVRFLDQLEASIPYEVLGYHPGSARADRRLRVEEWWLGDWSYAYEGERIQVSDLSLYGLVEGGIEIDVDGWVDWMMGGRLDDIRIVGFCIFREEDRRVGLAFGYNPDGKGRTGMLDLSTDELEFPVSKKYLTMGRALRARVEDRLARGRP